MKAFVHVNGDLKLTEMADPQAKRGEVVVSLQVAGLNRRDLYIPKRRGNAKRMLILGSDGAGTIESVGEGVTEFRVGDEVIINPALRWYENSAAPPKNFEILGMPDHGTFAEKIAISAEQIEIKPKYFSWEEAGVFALSALTAYRALFTKGQVKKRDTVFIPGAGSGVATFLVSFIKNIGAKVIVTSRSKEKQLRALELGADLVLDTNSDWQQQLMNETVDLVIESVGGATFNRSLEILKQGGRMVIFGATTEDNVQLNLREFFYGQYELLGSTMGSREELHAMLNHCQKYKLRPVVDRVFPLDEATSALQYLRNNKQFGKIALRIQ